MNILIVQGRQSSANIWQRHLEQKGASVKTANCQRAAVSCLLNFQFDAIILDVLLHEGSSLAVAELADFRQPEAKLIFVTGSSFFSDGSIYQHFNNVCGFLPVTTPPRDLVALVDHYANS